MNEEALNVSVRKFLKKVGITSQREIEQAVRSAVSGGKLKGNEALPAKVVLTGRKVEQKVYYKHTGYIGGIKERSAKAILAGRFPERIVEKAVERMLPRGPLGRRQLSNLRVYPHADHPHAAQQPEQVDIAAMNRKNKRVA